MCLHCFLIHIVLTMILISEQAHVKIAPVCNPTLQVIGLQIPLMENAGVAVDVLHLYLGLKY